MEDSTSASKPSRPSSLTVPISPPPKRQKKTNQTRKGYDHSQKKWLRNLYQTRCKNGSKPDYKELAKLFQEKYGGKLIGDGTITRCITAQGVYLDEPLNQDKQQRNRACKWPEMESSLWEWQLRKEVQGVPISGAILKEMALKFFTEFIQLLPEGYKAGEFKASTGWLDEYKLRHKTKKRVRHGEAHKVDLKALEDALGEIRQEIKDWLGDDFALDDVYNMDESALFWKMMPDSTLASEFASTSGTEQCKSRITANFCCNASGNHKLKPWFIGIAMTPRAFGSHGVKAENLRMVWRSNKTA